MKRWRQDTLEKIPGLLCLFLFITHIILTIITKDLIWVYFSPIYFFIWYIFKQSRK
jgi:hypothetical protein